MLVSGDPTQNLYSFICCVMALAIVGVIHLVKKHRERKKKGTEYKAFLERQQKGL